MYYITDRHKENNKIRSGSIFVTKGVWCGHRIIKTTADGSCATLSPSAGSAWLRIMQHALCVTLFLYAMPSTACAAVYISEIDWMGDTTSPNNEWIELHNDGDTAVPVDGWTLTDNNNLHIDVTGTIPAGAYPVLERTDDNSAPGPAFLIYTGSLPNSGDTLTLLDDNGTVIDQVAGGADWQNIGGDNTTKDTAQFTVNGWVTGPPTPGASNVTTSVVKQSSATDTTVSGVVTNTSSVVAVGNMDTPSTLVTNPPPLQVTIHGPTEVVVDQPVTLTAAARGPVKSILQSLVHTWNFGDLSTASGTTVTHRYQYPGDYVVTLHSAYRGPYIANTRFTIAVLPVRLSLTYVSGGAVQVHNDAPYEIDVSGYELQTGRSVLFPSGTILLAHATLTVSPRDTTFTPAPIMLRDDHGVVVATTSVVTLSPENNAIAPMTKVTPSPERVLLPAVGSSDTSAFTFTASDTASRKLIMPTEPATNTANQPLGAALPAAPVTTTTDTVTLVYFALVGVVALALLGVVAGRIR